MKTLIKKLLREYTEKGLSVYKNPFDPSMMVNVVDSYYDNWAFFDDIFSTYGHAFYAAEHNIIFINGEDLKEDWMTQDHVNVILAHETAHKIAGHTHGHDMESEMEADYMAWVMLSNKGMSSSVDIIVDEFKARYGISVDEFELDDRLMGLIQEV